MVMTIERHVFSWITFLLLIFDNNIENEKNKMLWEEQAYKISKKSNKKWKSHGGSKSAGNCKK